MSANLPKQETPQGNDSPRPDPFRSPELEAHQREIDQAAQAIISQIGDAPLVLDADQGIRIGRTRVVLDTVIAEYLNGATAEEIVEDYSTLALADVYGVIGFYLRHKTLVDAYAKARRQLGVAVEREIRSRQKNGSLREKLTSRMAVKARADG